MIPIVGRLAAQGLTLKNIAGAIGVTEKTLKAWRDEGSLEECDDSLKVELVMLLDAGRSQVTEEMMSCMKAHAMSDWKAAQAVLISMETESYNPTKKIEAKVETSENNGPADLSMLTLEQMQALREINRVIAEAKTKK